ncbi:MAG: hypothetical protein ACJ73S_03145 [Mycobacteriales bacterium]
MGDTASVTGSEPVQELARVLRDMWERAGSPELALLSARTGFPEQALERAFSGRGLTALGVVSALFTAFGSDQVAAEELWARTVAALDAEGPLDPAERARRAATEETFAFDPSAWFQPTAPDSLREALARRGSVSPHQPPVTAEPPAALSPGPPPVPPPVPPPLPPARPPVASRPPRPPRPPARSGRRSAKLLGATLVLMLGLVGATAWVLRPVGGHHHGKAPAHPGTKAAAPAPMPAGTFTATAGPGCPNGGTARVDTSATGDGWQQAHGAGPTVPGCADTFLVSQMAGTQRVDDTVTWTFHTGLTGPANCDVKVFVPNFTGTLGPVAYRLYDDKVSDQTQIKRFNIIQSQQRGQWYDQGRYQFPAPATILLVLTDGGFVPDHSVAAGPVQLTCGP